MKEKFLYKDWEQFRISLLKETTPVVEDLAEKERRVASLKMPGNHEDFFIYYFPNYCKSKPAAFHKRASKRVLENKHYYEVRAWSRELAKSARTMMEVIYLALTGQVKNVLLISNSNKSAVNLLTPYRINFEANQRILGDYGAQVGLKWEEGHFITTGGVSFLAFGAGETPRGSRNEEIRPDVVIFDDIDTDEEVRNISRISKKWDWIEQAVIPTVSVSNNYRIIFCGNIIGKDTCITRAMKFADNAEIIINIRNKEGLSTWPEKNTEEQIDKILSKISYRSAQKEYFNNPIAEGTIFKQITWGKLPDIRNFKFIVKYGDPSYSNRTNKKNSSKCVVALGEHAGIYYIFNCRLDKVTNDEFVKWHWQLDEDLPARPQIYNYIENNTLQDPFFTQVLKPLFEENSLKSGKTINPFGDDRKKPEKFFRIEGNLEPLNRDGKLVFDEKQANNPHMKKLAEQFLDFSEENLSDGPDAVEGAVWIINNKLKRIGSIISRPFIARNRKSRY